MSYLSIVQIVVAVLLVITILLQQRGGGLGGAFGGEGGGFYAARRGLQQKLHWATITLGITFVGLALLNLLF
ncbi:preprotein translocase subunit SecG [Patescibacteria group bacterium]|nr:preprotein translocase subunit SecG [Patescibacteria group bacterium]MCH8244289.1 preprotein translocase subunit SecG [Patescibacteria group bacterium]